MPKSKHSETQPVPAKQSAPWKDNATNRQGDDRVDQWSDVVSIPVAGGGGQHTHKPCNEKKTDFMEQVRGREFPRGKCDNWMKWFVYSSGSILCITGLAKIISTHGDAKILDLSDPIFKVSFRHIILLTGNLELIISFFCFFGKTIKSKIGVLAWLASVFTLYRIGLIAVGYRKPCPCLGNLTDTLHISTQAANVIAKIILAYLLIGSCCSLIYLSKKSASKLSK